MDGTEEPSGAGEVAADTNRDDRSKRFLSWPPPGLEEAQGQLWPPIALIAVGDVTLVLPLLWSAATHQELWSFGPFGNSWWIPMLTTMIGLLIYVYGMAKLSGLLRLCSRSAKQGHGWLMVVQVAADFPKDTGFLFQGARIFSDMAPAKRSLVLVTRVVNALAYLVAAVWVPLGFVLSIMLGARGLLGPSGVWFITLAPAGLLLLVGLLGRVLGKKLTWDVRRDRELHAVVDEEVRSLVTVWNDQAAPTRRELGFDLTGAGNARTFKLSAFFVLFLAVFVFIPLITVTFTGAIGSVVAAIAVPSFESAQARVAVAEVLRRYRIEPDGSVGAVEAGEALHSLLSVTVEPAERFLEQRPVRSYQQQWFPEDVDSITVGTRMEWVLGLFERVPRGLSRAERDYLASIAAHPAHAEFHTIAMADSVDIVGTRFTLPFPDTVNPFQLPIPRFVNIREGANAHVALAAYELDRGRRDRAEEVVREVMSVGFVLMDEGSTIIDAMIGTRLVETGAEALEKLLTATGRNSEAENLMWVRTGLGDALERMSVTRSAVDAEGGLRMMPRAVLNESVVRGLRWEHFLTFTTLAPCANLNKVVFGPGEDYEQWLDEAEAALVRRQSEAEMFRFLEGGWFKGGGVARAPGWMRSFLRLTFGDSMGGVCAAQIGAMSMVSSIN